MRTAEMPYFALCTEVPNLRDQNHLDNDTCPPVDSKDIRNLPTSVHLAFWTEGKSNSPEDRMICYQVNMHTHDDGKTWHVSDVRLPGQNTGAHSYKHGTGKFASIYRRMPFHCPIGHHKFGDLIAHEGLSIIAQVFFGVKIAGPASSSLRLRARKAEWLSRRQVRGVLRMRYC